jgi:hypothetical protein
MFLLTGLGGTFLTAEAFLTAGTFRNIALGSFLAPLLPIFSSSSLLLEDDESLSSDSGDSSLSLLLLLSYFAAILAFIFFETTLGASIISG